MNKERKGLSTTKNSIEGLHEVIGRMEEREVRVNQNKVKKGKIGEKIKGTIKKTIEI